jgi:hypothetical protein
MDAAFVAKTIYGQIRAVDFASWWAWGSSNAKAIEEGIVPHLGFVMGGLSFTVNGFKFQGTVKVFLMVDDTYSIQIGVEDGNFIPKETRENVYCDVLMFVIDQLVERDWISFPHVLIESKPNIKGNRMNPKSKPVEPETLKSITVTSEDYLAVKALFYCVASKSEINRPALHQVFYNPKADEFVACDGHLLRVHKAEWREEEQQKPMRGFYLLEIDFLHTQTSLRKSNLNTVQIPIHYLEHQYPDYPKLIRPIADGAHLNSFGIDLDLIVRFRKSFTSENVILEFRSGKNNLQGFQVYRKGKFVGVVMPIKILKP